MGNSRGWADRASAPRISPQTAFHSKEQQHLQIRWIPWISPVDSLLYDHSTSKMSQNFQSPPPNTKFYILSFPKPQVMLVTINRAKHRNSLPMESHWEAHRLFTWFDHEPNLLVAVVTGAGDKAFCAGQDLVEQSTVAAAGPISPLKEATMNHPPSGFMGLSQRRGKKPVIAAVNGFALGGGFEICLNWWAFIPESTLRGILMVDSDIVVASPTAQFGLPEVTVGLYAGAGGLARIVRICGMQVASEISMTARRLSAKEALDYHLINKISKSRESVVEEAVAMAEHIASYSPDAIILTRQGLRESWENPSVEHAAAKVRQEYNHRLRMGENFKIGVDAFANKTKPKWVPSRL